MYLMVNLSTIKCLFKCLFVYLFVYFLELVTGIRKVLRDWSPSVSGLLPTPPVSMKDNDDTEEEEEENVYALSCEAFNINDMVVEVNNNFIKCIIKCPLYKYRKLDVNLKLCYH